MFALSTMVSAAPARALAFIALSALAALVAAVAAFAALSLGFAPWAMFVVGRLFHATGSAYSPSAA